MNQPVLKEIVLIRSASYNQPMSRCKKYVLLALFAFVILLPVIYCIWRIYPVWHKLSGPVLADFFLKQLQEMRENPMDTLPEMIPLLFAIVSIGIIRLRKKERLVVNAEGIHYQPPFFRIFRLISPEWRVLWTEVREIRIKPLRYKNLPANIVLEIDTASKCYLIKPLHWLDPDHSSAEQYRLARLMSIRNAEEFHALWVGHPIIRFLDKINRAPQTGDLVLPTLFDFDLMRNIHTRTTIFLFFLFFFYAVVDLMIHMEVYAGRPFHKIYFLIAVVAAALNYVWLKKANVPRKETMGLALLLGAVVGFAAYPGALRLNQLTDRQGLQSYDYQMQADYSFVPDRKDLPVLAFPRDRSYWSRYPRGYRYAFKLRKGGLGFYQVDLAPVYEKFQQDRHGKKNG